MVRVFPHGGIELKLDGEAQLKVNGPCVRHYMGNTNELKVCVDVSLGEV